MEQKQRPNEQSGLRVTLLGGFVAGVGPSTVPPEAWRRRKPAALLKILALAPDHRMHRERLIELLWPELEPAAAGANLRKAIYQARTAVNDARRGAGHLIAFENDVLSLATEGLIIDTDSFRSALTGARRSGDHEAYRMAIDIYSGELLPDDLYEDWAAAPRRELHEDHVAGLSEWCGLLESQGEIEEAIKAGRRLVAAEPTREDSHLLMMRLYGLTGRRSDALRQYDRLAEVLDQELGVEPSVSAQRLREEINASRADEPDLTAELWERVGDLRVLAGDGTGAAKAFERALGVDGTETGHKSVAARIERKCGEAWLMQHRPDMAESHLEAARILPMGADEEGRLFRARANLAWATGQIPLARQLAGQARELATACGAPEDLAAAREALAIVSHFEGEWREGLESELERLATSEGDGQLARVFDIHHCIGQYHLYGDALFESVEGYARRILDRAEEVGAIRAQAFAWCLLGESLLLQARWEEADGCLERSCLLHDSLGSRSGALVWQRRAELAACQRRQDDVDAHLRRASGIATVSAMASHMWGRIHATAAFAAMDRDDPGTAVHAVQAATAARARYGDCPTCSALLNPVAAAAFASFGDAGNARYYRDAAQQVADHFSSSAWKAMAESAAGSVSALDGDRVAARGHFASASELYSKAGQPYWAERSARDAV